MKRKPLYAAATIALTAGVTFAGVPAMAADAAPDSTPTVSTEAPVADVVAPVEPAAPVDAPVATTEPAAPAAEGPAPIEPAAPVAVTENATPAEPAATEVAPEATTSSTPAEVAPLEVAAPAAAPSTLGKDSPALSSTNENPTVVDGVTQTLPARAGFRVLPYLQMPKPDSMTVNFFSETGTPATIVVKGPGLPAAGATYTVNGTYNPITDYQESELKQGDLKQPNKNAELTDRQALNQGTWIRSNIQYKYSQTILGLTPASDYSYSVTVDGYTHEATFTTSPLTGVPVTNPIHIIAFSDTETDPVGRVTYREWVKNPLTADSESRPDALDSAWVKKFGNDNRDGGPQLRYMLTEDQAQRLNNEIIKQASPDMLLIAGDITERASSQTHWDEWFCHFAGDQNAILDEIPSITSPGNHEVYGYCANVDDCTQVIRARAEYNYHFDTNGSDKPEARDSYHRTDYGPITFISLDSTNGTDQTPATVPDSMKFSGNDANLTPEQYGTDTQNAYTIEQYERDFPKSVENGWWGEGADPTRPDQPNFMPGSDQYKWLEAQLKQAREAGQVIVVQWHHVAYSNGTHGTTMGLENYSDAQPGTPMRHLQPLLEQYGVAAVISGHDETFQASYVDEDKNGIGIYHWDVGVASDGLRGEKMIKDPNNPDGEYIPLSFNTHSVWMAQRNEAETWKTNTDGVKQLISGGKHYGYLDINLKPYVGAALSSGIMPTSVLEMMPTAMFPILDNNYDVVNVEARAMTNGLQKVYFDLFGNILDPNAAPAEAPEVTPTTPVATDPVYSDSDQVEEFLTNIGQIDAVPTIDAYQGETITLKFAGLGDSTDVTSYFYSVATLIGSGISELGGNYSIDYTVPADATLGTHYAIAQSSNGMASIVRVNVLEAVTEPTDDDDTTDPTDPATEPTTAPTDGTPSTDDDTETDDDGEKPVTEAQKPVIPASDKNLANTGVESSMLGEMALALVAGGLVLLVARKRFGSTEA